MVEMEQFQRITEHIQNIFSAEPEHLWLSYPDYSVFRHPVSGKWFAIIMDIPKCKLGLDGQERVWVMDIKCAPVMTGSLLSQKGFFPAYHMNKTSWISILLDDSVPDADIAPLLELSYDSVAGHKKKKRDE